MRRITLVAVGPDGIGRDLTPLAAAMDAFAKRPKGTAFEVLTADPSRLLGAYGDRHQIWPIGVRRRHGALGALSLSSFASARRTSLTLLVGELREGGLTTSLGWFGAAAILAAARRAGRPVVASGLVIAPFRSVLGRAAAARLLRTCSNLRVADEASRLHAGTLGVDTQVSSDPVAPGHSQSA